jgi:hypothetical protein
LLTKGLMVLQREKFHGRERKKFYGGLGAGNKHGFTNRHFEDSKKARKLYHTLGCPTVVNFKHILRQNLLKNCPINIDDVVNAERIFWPDIGTLKGKSTRKVPVPVKTDEIEELKEMHKDLTLCIDIMFINGMPMLTSIDRSIRFRALVALDNRSGTAIFDGLDSIYRIYKKSGFTINGYTVIRNSDQSWTTFQPNWMSQ